MDFKDIMSCACCRGRRPVFTMHTKVYGKLAFSQPVQLYQLSNKHGMELSVISYGARIVGLKVPSMTGELVDVVRGLKDFEAYQKDEFYFGAIVGRMASRIHPNHVNISGKEFVLVPNTDMIHHNGGKNGFDTAVWTSEPLEENQREGVTAVKFRYVSPPGSEGYPGELLTEVEYRLTNHNELIMKVVVKTEEPTIVSIPNHAYFNLGGPTERNVYDHWLTINAETYTPTDGQFIPSGEIKPVAGTPYDFRSSKRIGDIIGQLPGDGFDDNWCPKRAAGMAPTSVSRLYCPSTGIDMEIKTTQPGLTVYTANYLSKDIIGKYDEICDKHSAICLQAHCYPNAPHHENFPSALLTPGQTYEHTTIYSFSTHRSQQPRKTDYGTVNRAMVDSPPK